MSGPAALDATDWAILDRMQADATLSACEVAAAVGISPAAVRHRIRRMRGAGVLRGVHADVDPKRLGVGLEAILSIELEGCGHAAAQTFLDGVSELPEVRFAFMVTGRHDAVVLVAVRDIHHLAELIRRRFTNGSGVRGLEASIVLEERRARRVVDLRASG